MTENEQPINVEYTLDALSRLYKEATEADNSLATILLFYDITNILESAGIEDAPERILGSGTIALIEVFTGTKRVIA